MEEKKKRSNFQALAFKGSKDIMYYQIFIRHTLNEKNQENLGGCLISIGHLVEDDTRRPWVYSASIY